MNIKSRIKLLIRIAQEANEQIITSDEVKKDIGNPPSFNAQSYYPEVNKAWGTGNAQKIYQIGNLLNDALFRLSQGKLNLEYLRNQSFTTPDTATPDINAKRLINLCGTYNDYMLTYQGERWKNPLNKDQIDDIKEVFINDDAFRILPEGDIDPKLSGKPSASLKSQIRNILNQISFTGNVQATQK